MLFGFSGEDHSKQVIDHTCELALKSGRPPTKEELVTSMFPHGPGKVDIYIGTGWLKCGLAPPSVLDEGKTDLYFINHLPLTLNETTLKRILYDYLFLRRDGYSHFNHYKEDDLSVLQKYYDDHKHCVVGLGDVIGPKAWYAHHTCVHDEKNHGAHDDSAASRSEEMQDFIHLNTK